MPPGSAQKQIEKDLEHARIAARNVLEDLQVEKGKLAEAKARDDAILASIGDGMVIIDLAGKITFINEAAQELLGWKSTQVVGKPLFDVVPLENAKGEVWPAATRPMAIALSTGSATLKEKKARPISMLAKVPYEMYYVRKDKKKFPVAMNCTSVLLKGKIVGAVEVFRDITKEKEADRAKSEFVSLASHQLRTPITTINWYSEMLLRSDGSIDIEKQKEYLEKIHTGSQQMVTLVNTLLNVSRIELGTLLVASKPVQIRDLLQETINEQKLQIDEKKISVTEHFSKELPTLETDSNLLRMVFQNLLNNAIKYTASNGRVDISTTLEKDTTALIAFSDTGYGIPAKDQDKIFTKMFRADNVKEKAIEGTGLGLYMVKAILATLGGSVRFESEENKGTTFYVTIPL